MNLSKDGDSIKLGFEGEGIIRELFKKNGLTPFFQADLLFKSSEKWYLAEVKTQEMFEAGGACKFNGHGLPVWQVEHRLKFERETGVEAVLFVIELPTRRVLWQRLSVLDNGEKFITKKSSRVIYPLSAFNEI